MIKVRYRALTFCLLGMLLVVLPGAALAGQPQTSSDWLAKGQAFLTDGDYDSAYFAYCEAIRLDPGNAEAFYNRGLFFQMVKAHAFLAIADYSRAVELDPTMVSAYENRGLLYGLTGQSARAAADFAEVIKLDPEQTEAFYYRGLAYQQSKQYEKAVEDFSKAIEIRPDDAAAYSSRGECYIEQERYESAIADYNQAIALKPGTALYFVNRGHAQGRLKNFEQALRDSYVATKLEPSSVAAQFNLAQAFELTGNRIGAQEHYKLALQGMPPDRSREREKAEARLQGKWEGYQEWL
ncbi:MAG TPA: tetratricopeptide repeat protein [Selenomonadales bacterium]|nr:tetratricopeptide repeat protein [Selenomonadales bacterium]